jgi:mannose-6-phosphate isomerase
MKEPIFLNAVFKERIWGGTALRDIFKYDIPSDHTGECWGISAHPNGPSTVKNGPFKGKTLAELWKGNRELFADQEGEEFPLLVKILDAAADLSVQVHPDDRYAQEKVNEPFGKTECWYVIDCEEGSELIYGHHAQTRDGFEKMVETGEWDHLLRRVNIKPGDFFYVPSGTIHAIGHGTMILETQQSSDITYRVYDYDRKDSSGDTRELHIEQSIDVATIPHIDPIFTPVVTKTTSSVLTKLVSEKYFTVYNWELSGEEKKQLDAPYLLVSVLDGKGSIDTSEATNRFKKGDHFIIPATVNEYTIKGEAKFIISHP